MGTGQNLNKELDLVTRMNLIPQCLVEMLKWLDESLLGGYYVRKVTATVDDHTA